MSEYVSTEVAMVYRFGGRRYFTKRSAFAAKAKAWMMRNHERFGQDDLDIGAYCVCHFCDDYRNNGGKLHKRLTRYLMRCDRRKEHTPTPEGQGDE